MATTEHDTTLTNVDYDVMADAAHIAGLAITEATGSSAHVMTSARSGEIGPDGLLSFRLFLPVDTSAREREAIERRLLDLDPEVQADLHDGLGFGEDMRGRPFVDVYGVDTRFASVWARVARQRITPGSRA